MPVNREHVLVLASDGKVYCCKGTLASNDKLAEHETSGAVFSELEFPLKFISVAAAHDGESFGVTEDGCLWSVHCATTALLKLVRFNKRF